MKYIKKNIYISQVFYLLFPRRMIKHSATIRKRDIKNKVNVLFHKFMRFTKNQKTFVLYLFGLAFLLLFFPIISIAPVADETYRIWLLSGNFFTTMVIVFISVLFLLWWNMSFRFKNIVINYLGFKENDDLINFVFLWIIIIIFFAIGNTVKLSQSVTSTIWLTTSYYFTRIYLLGWLIFCLYSVVKWAKAHSGKTKIINVIDEKAHKEIEGKKSLHGLFDHDNINVDED